MKNTFDQLSPPSKPEFDPSVTFEAIWKPHPSELQTNEDSDIGTLTVLVAGANHINPMTEVEDINLVEGTISYDLNDQGLKMAMISESHLEGGYKGRGIGVRMYKAFTRLAVEHGATHIGGISPSLDAMRTRARVFGVERMKFYEAVPGKGEEKLFTGQEISLEEAVHRTNLRQNYEQLLVSMHRKYGDDIIRSRFAPEDIALLEESFAGQSFYVLTDLTGLDVSDWESEVAAKTAD